MTKDSFMNLVTKLILPLFTGSQIVGEEESSSRDLEVAQGTNGTVLLKPHKSEEYRLILKRSQPFKTNDVSLIRSIVLELVKISEYGIEEEQYIKRLQTTAIEKAICQAVSEKASKTLLGITNSVLRWANRTYEGKRLNFGIVINQNETIDNPSENLHYTKVLSQDFFALLTDGKQSCVEFDLNGYLINYKPFERLRSMPTSCPSDYVNIAKYCNEARIGVALIDSGDLLIFSNRELKFAYRKGNWSSYCHEEIIQLLSNKTSHTIKEIRKAIYYTALDCSFSNTGGCLVYLFKDKSEQALSHIDINDIISCEHYEMKKEQPLLEALKHAKGEQIKDYTYDEFLNREACTKANALKSIIRGKKFHELSRKFRAEMLAMDGATIVDYDGTIIAAGAIVKIEAGSSGGGRLAATKTLAKYGVAIKISMDGMMQCFYFDKKTNKSKVLFSVG